MNEQNVQQKIHTHTQRAHVLNNKLKTPQNWVMIRCIVMHFVISKRAAVSIGSEAHITTEQNKVMFNLKVNLVEAENRKII